jgi:predicted outer membrane lipoprotein
MRRDIIRFGVVLAVVIAAHIALWLSHMPFDAKLRLTLLNGAVWTVILVPAVGVALWLRATTTAGRGRNGS